MMERKPFTMPVVVFWGIVLLVFWLSVILVQLFAELGWIH